MATEQLTQGLHLRRRRVHEQIADHLQATIANQGLLPGTQLPSGRQLSEEMGVSRATVSEAMRLLEARGLVERKPGSGTFVANRVGQVLVRSMERLSTSAGCSREDLATFREILEPAVAALAAQRASQRDLDKLSDLLGQMTEAARHGDADAYVSADTEFHATLAGATGNKLIAAVALGLQGLVQPALNVVRKRGVSPASLGRHSLILEAVAARDATAAAEAMRRSIRDFRRAMGGAGEENDHGGGEHAQP